LIGRCAVHRRNTLGVITAMTNFDSGRRHTLRSFPELEAYSI
jgi:hypothetical protein